MTNATEPRHKSREVLASAFVDLEPEICDLVRRADLAVYLYHEEVLEETPITDGGSTLCLVLDDLARCMKEFKKSYYKAYTRARGDPGTKPRRRKKAEPKLTVVSNNGAA